MFLPTAYRWRYLIFFFFHCFVLVWLLINRDHANFVRLCSIVSNFSFSTYESVCGLETTSIAYAYFNSSLLWISARQSSLSLDMLSCFGILSGVWALFRLSCTWICIFESSQDMWEKDQASHGDFIFWNSLTTSWLSSWAQDFFRQNGTLDL